MGWTVHIQIVRDRPLSLAERKTLARHVRAFKLSGQSEGYGFLVAPPAAAGGVIAQRIGKLARSPDDAEDRDAARLYEALTALRTLLPETTLEVADDFRLVGWDGQRYALVQHPDQELTCAPRDTSSWLPVPPPRAPRTRAVLTPAAPKPKRDALPTLFEAALAEMAERRAPVLPPVTPDEARVLVPLLFAARTRADRAGDGRRGADLATVLDHMPAHVVVDLGLSPALLASPSSHAIARALERIADPSPYAERLLAIWFGREAGKGAEQLWSSAAPALAAAARDPRVVARLGAALLEADLDAWREFGRRHTLTMDVLAAAPGGLPWLVRKRRADRPAKGKNLTGVLLDGIARTRRPEAVPTLLLELARPGADRDELLLQLSRIDDPRVLPMLERVLATGQYTRTVAKALFNVAGDRAEALLDSLDGSADPLVRIRAAQGLVVRRGREAIPRLLAAAADAAASGAWRGESPVGGWSSEQLRGPEDALITPPFEVRRTGQWPRELETMTVPAAAGVVEPMNAWARMRSLNPDVRRDAIEAAHELALTARDPSVILALVAAERLHAAMLERADVSQYTVRGSCSRVNVTNYWSSWSKLARIPFDPMYKYTYVTWNHLAAHAAEVAPQQVPSELADLLTVDAVMVAVAAMPEQRLRFAPDELAAWDAEERAVIG